MTHRVAFRSPVDLMDDKLTSGESSVHASKTPKLIPSDDFSIFLNCQPRWGEEWLW